MNIRQVLMVTAIVTLSAAAAMAQNTPASSAGESHKGRHEMKFEDRKAHALERLEKAAAKIQAKQACVQASTDKTSLQACFPKRGEGKANWHRHGDADKANDAAPTGK